MDPSSRAALQPLSSSMKILQVGTIANTANLGVVSSMSPNSLFRFVCWHALSLTPLPACLLVPAFSFVFFCAFSLAFSAFSFSIWAFSACFLAFSASLSASLQVFSPAFLLCSAFFGCFFNSLSCFCRSFCHLPLLSVTANATCEHTNLTSVRCRWYSYCKKVKSERGERFPDLVNDDFYVLDLGAVRPEDKLSFLERPEVEGVLPERPEVEGVVLYKVEGGVFPERLEVEGELLERLEVEGGVLLERLEVERGVLMERP